MALKIAPRRSLIEIVRYVLLFAFRLSKFESEAAGENVKVETAPNDTRGRTAHIRTALGRSFVVVVLATAFGAIAGWTAAKVLGRPVDWLLILLQVTGAFLVLWATLAIRGWEIGSFAGTTLEEELNRWVYRSLYTVGTFLFIWSLVWGWLTGSAT